MEIKEALKQGIKELNKEMIEEANLKAKILLEYQLKIAKGMIVMYLEDEISRSNAKTFFSNHTR